MKKPNGWWNYLARSKVGQWEFFSGQKYLIFCVFLWLAWLNCAHLGMLKSSCPPAQGKCQWRLWTVTLMTSQVVQGNTLLLAVHDPVRQQSRRMMGVVRGLNASMTSLYQICWSKKQFLSDSRQKATQIFYQHETEKIAEKNTSYLDSHQVVSVSFLTWEILQLPFLPILNTALNLK